MADETKNNQTMEKTFATSGTEMFNLGKDAAKAASQSTPSGRIILNIQEDRNRGILLEKKKMINWEKLFGTGFVGSINNFLITHSNISDEMKANFYHLLSVMVNAGIPMLNSIKALSQQSDTSPRLKIVLEELLHSVEGGKSLSESMLPYADVFSEKEIGMIRAGEASGQLAMTLDNLASDTSKSAEIKKKIKSAMMYPIVVVVLLFGVITALMIFVVPKLTGLFAGMGAKLPLLTRIVVGISDFMVNNTIMLVVGILGVIIGFLIFRKTDVGKYSLDLFKVKVPIFGPLFRKAYLSRFSRSLSNLLSSGLSIVTTLEIVANSVGNEVYRKRLLNAAEDIKQGIPLAETLAESEYFPPMLLSMIDIGEKTAQLDTILNKVATFYEMEVDTSVNGMSKIVEPVILIVIGGTVGVVVGAVMLPIMQMSDLAGKM